MDFTVAVYVGLVGILALLAARRHAGGDLDAGRAVHRADRRLPDPGGHPVRKKYGIPVPQLTYGQASQEIGALEQKMVAAGPGAGEALKPHTQPFVNLQPAQLLRR
jgi:cation/acetate symporter